MPLLTRFYQANAPEPLAFARAEGDEPDPNDLDELKPLHRLVVPLMDAMDDGGGVPARLLKEIRPLLHGPTRQQQPFSFSPTEEEEAALNVTRGCPVHLAARKG